MDIYLVPFRQPYPPTRFLSITDHWNVSLPSGASLWNGMFGLIEGQYTTKLDGNYTRMLCVVLKKAWKQHPTKKQLLHKNSKQIIYLS